MVNSGVSVIKRLMQSINFHVTASVVGFETL